MNYNISLILTTICIVFFSSNHKKINKLRRDLNIIQAKADFIASQNVKIDSTIVRKDTLLFFNNGVFLGSSVIVKK
jgi:hypothetical protein